MRSVQFEQDTKDHHRLPGKDKPLAFGRSMAADQNLRVSDHVIADRRFVSTWLDARQPKPRTAPTRFSSYPSSKQVAVAEHIARIKRRDVTRERFKGRPEWRVGSVAISDALLSFSALIVLTQHDNLTHTIIDRLADRQDQSFEICFNVGCVKATGCSQDQTPSCSLSSNKLMKP